MFVLFEEAGKYLGGRILSEAESSAQVELDSGKRVKVKGANIVLRFDKPAPADLIAEAREIASTMDLDMAWEFAPEGEFSFADLASDYFQANPPVAQQAGALFALFEAPHYFRRAGKGRFKKASAEVVQQALAAIEKKKAVQAQIDEWARELATGVCPAPVREQLYKILFRPDKNAPEYKAVVDAARATQRPPLDLLKEAGAIDSAYQFHWRRFLFENFPKGTGFPDLSAPAPVDDLPLAEVEAFSIDDSQTTEIDDALSVRGLGGDTVTVGIHIAAPGLALTPGGPIDQVARARMSTVYMPGHKITMLPDDVVAAYTLQAGRDCPAVSLYATFDAATLDLRSTETRLERVPIVANLRHDQLDGIVTAEWLDDLQSPDGGASDELARLRAPLSFLFRLAKQLRLQREVVRGKPENFNRPDYTFRLADHD
ncbi:MAG: RNB domain-containing ribonuclease, partial [Gammaproteobacteria bacterium]|nr:RNB domain-containing ribonuclease [Gammaproteobacteria bacterium]